MQGDMSEALLEWIPANIPEVTRKQIQVERKLKKKEVEPVVPKYDAKAEGDK